VRQRQLADWALSAIEANAAPKSEIVDSLIRHNALEIVRVIEREKDRRPADEGEPLARVIDQIRERYAL